MPKWGRRASVQPPSNASRSEPYNGDLADDDCKCRPQGAFQTVHGIGESLRGNAMDFVDSATGTENRGHGAAVRGQQMTAVGVNNMENSSSRHTGTGTTGYGSGGVTGTTATTTSTAPSATPAGNFNATGGGAGVGGIGTRTGRAGAI